MMTLSGLSMIHIPFVDCMLGLTEPAPLLNTEEASTYGIDQNSRATEASNRPKYGGIPDLIEDSGSGLLYKIKR